MLTPANDAYRIGPTHQREFFTDIVRKGPVAARIVLSEKLSNLLMILREMGIGEGGIRTHVPFRTRRFRGAPVTTTSVPLREVRLSEADPSLYVAAKIIGTP